MLDAPILARVANLIGEEARAQMLCALMLRGSLTATELALEAGVTAQTASGHLAKMLDGGLLKVKSQGRNRYYSLAHQDVLEAMEGLLAIGDRLELSGSQGASPSLALRDARRCYDHLGGRKGILLFENLLERGVIEETADGGLRLTLGGARFLHDFGISIPALKDQRRPACRTCRDWLERSHHLSGALGAALLDRFVGLGWVRLSPDNRLIEFTPFGEKAFSSLFTPQAIGMKPKLKV